MNSEAAVAAVHLSRNIELTMTRTPPLPTRTTLQSIAVHAGVSISSVSTVLNHRHLERRISTETVQKIRETAVKLGYMPNISARQLRSGRNSRNSIVLALVTSFEAPIPLINHFIFSLRNAASQQATLAGGTISVMVEMFSARTLRDLPGILTGDHFNAAMFLNTTAEDDLFIQRSYLPYPAVLVNRIVPGYPAVCEDRMAGARAATILAAKRRVDLGVLHGSPLTQITQARVDSFLRQAAATLGKEAHEISTDNLSPEGGFQAMRDFLRRGGKVDGLYAVSDALALGAFRALKEAGLRIPHDVAVMGVGDFDSGPYFDPPLASVGVCHRALANKASELLLEQLVHPGAPCRHVSLPVIETLGASVNGAIGR